MAEELLHTHPGQVTVACSETTCTMAKEFTDFLMGQNTLETSTTTGETILNQPLVSMKN